ncbi:MAG: amidase, partial [Bacteroidia bacterium]
MNNKSVIQVIIIFAIMQTGCSGPLKKAEPFIIEEATIASIHNAYRSGSLTATELVSLYIERIEKYDSGSSLNSIVIINPEALKDAARLDSLFEATGRLLPLHGIPIIVKDNIDTRGLQTAAGSLAMKGFEPASDARIVKLLREAGAIVLCKSNMAEWAFSPMVTISSIAGETLNPYNTAYVPAGSSGGTAAAVAANFGTAGLGTDTGNSIRGPSSHNALVGFRSTIGLVSRSGIVPLYLRNDVVGPMARSVEDAVIMLDVIAGYDPGDPVTINSKGKVPESYLAFLDKNGLKGSRIGVLRIL